MKNIKIEWCENWLKKAFAKLPNGITGIERDLLFSMAEKAGLYEHDTYGAPLTEALTNLTKCDVVNDANGNFAYHTFRIA